MPLEITLPCASCGLRIPTSTMRYGFSGRKLLCSKCFDSEAEGSGLH